MEGTDVKIFVAGATGVLGRRVVPLLVAGGHSVSAVARDQRKSATLVHQGATPVEVDLFDATHVAHAVLGHAAIVNLATAIPPAAQMTQPSAWDTNTRLRTEASRNLVDAALAAGAQRYIQEAVAFQYHDHGSEWIAEDAPVRPSPTVAPVKVAEANARRFDDRSEAGVVLRFGIFYSADSVLTRGILELAQGGILAMPGRDDSYQPWIHVDDAASAVVAALDAPGGVYNVVEDHPMTNAEHAAVLGELLGRQLVRPPELMADGTSEFARSQRVSNGRIRDASGWRPRFPSRRAGWSAVLADLRGERAPAS